MRRRLILFSVAIVIMALILEAVQKNNAKNIAGLLGVNGYSLLTMEKQSMFAGPYFRLSRSPFDSLYEGQAQYHTNVVRFSAKTSTWKWSVTVHTSSGDIELTSDHNP